MDLLWTRTGIQTGIADPMVLMWTAVVGECVSVGGACVSRAGLAQYMGNTVRLTTSLARTWRGFCVAVRGYT